MITKFEHPFSGKERSVYGGVANPKGSYALYILLCFRTLFSVLFVALAKTYSFAIFGAALACANCKCVWLYALASSIIFISSSDKSYNWYTNSFILFSNSICSVLSLSKI